MTSRIKELAQSCPVRLCGTGRHFQPERGGTSLKKYQAFLPDRCTCTYQNNTSSKSLHRLDPRDSAALVWKHIADGGEKRNLMDKACPSALRCGRRSRQCWKFTGSPGKCALNLRRGVQGSGQNTQFYHEKQSHSMQMQGSASNGRGYVLVKNPFQHHMRKYTQDCAFQGLPLDMFINGCQFMRPNYHASFIKIRKKPNNI